MTTTFGHKFVAKTMGTAMSLQIEDGCEVSVAEKIFAKLEVG